MANPKVSVLIPAYNHEAYVAEAIQSVLSQTFSDLELIIINDGSTDQTESEVLKFQDGRIRYYLQENRGLSATLNRGIGLARGEYFNFLPSDDAFFPEKLEIQLRVFSENPRLGLVFSYPQLVDAGGKEIPDDPAALWPIVPYETKEEIFPALFERNFLSAPTALIKMECFQRAGLFDESLRYAQDYDLWMRILKHYDIRLLKQPLIKYRWHGENLTFQSTPRTEAERTKILLKAFKDLDIEEVFPSLREEPGEAARARAYETLAGYMEKSGVPVQVPVAQIYRELGRSLESVSFPPPGATGGTGHSLRGKDGRIHLLMETRSLDRGGLEEVIYNIARHLDQDLFRVVIVCTGRGGSIAEKCKKMGIPVEILGEEKEREYREILLRYEVDLVVVHYSTLGIKIAFETGIPVISFLHNIYCWVSDQVMGEMKMSDSMINGYVAVSEDVKRFTSYRFNVPSEKIIVIPNGIDIERLQERPDLPFLTKNELGFDERDYVFLNVAGFAPAKAHPVILAALKEVVTEFPEAKVLCIGEVQDREYYEFLKTQISTGGLEGRIRLVDFTENIAAYYRIADAFLLPSVIEGWSLAALEAMAHGLPLILTKVGGAARMIENEDIGVLIKNQFESLFDIDVSGLGNYRREDFPNVVLLKEAMARFLREKSFWKTAGMKGQQKIRQQFTIQKIAKSYELLFLSTSVLGLKASRDQFITQTRKLLHESENLVGERDHLLKTQEESLDGITQDLQAVKSEIRGLQQPFQAMGSEIRGLQQHLQEREGEIQELRRLVEVRYRNLDDKIEYVLLRMSIKERIRERMRKAFKATDRFVPKRVRDGYRLFYQRYFLNNFSRNPERPDPIPPAHLPLTAPRQISPKPSGLDFLIFPIIEWELRYQRPQQVAERLAKKGHRVFYVRTRPTVVDDRSLTQKDIGPLLKVEEFKRNIYFVTLVSQKDFNLYQDLLCDDESLRYLSFSLEALKDRFGIRHTLSIVDLPFWFPLVNLLPDNRIVYDCMDDHAHFSTNRAETMTGKEKELLGKADLVFASSKILFEKGRERNRNTILVKNGVDVEHFSSLPASDVLERIPGPIIGYHGAISDWFDTDLLAKCARAYPHCHFVLIGSTFGADLNPFLGLENVHLLGEIAYTELPKYLKHFDVCLIPFKINPLTQAANPVKFYEYLCTGKPLVTVALPELSEHEDLCYYSKDPEEFIANIQKALVEKDEILKRRRIEFANENSWDQRVNQMLEATKRLFPRVSIIIVTFNNLEYLRLCLESIFNHSGYPNFELIIVDNHSQDQTREYLEKLREEKDNLKTVWNEKNMGFAGGNNAGLKMASGEYIVLLNDDTIVTQDWIHDLVDLLQNHPRLGMIGPVSNNVGNIQKVEVGYGKNGNELQGWAKEYTGQQAKDYRAIPMIGFFCVMMRKEVFEKVGFLDETYQTGMFEDDDYCKRIREAGYEIGYTRRVFVHHEGSVSFNKLDAVDFKKIWKKNKNYFEKKWAIKWSNEFTEFIQDHPKERFDLRKLHEHQLKKVLENNARPIAVFPPLIDWYTPVFQRPPHIAENLAKSGYLVFFCTENQRYDKAEGFLKLMDNLYLTDEYSLLKRIGQKGVIYFIYSTENKTTYEKWKEEVQKGQRVVYEYIDEIHESITGGVPQKTLDRHHSILKDERFSVTATADKLYQEGLTYRSRNCALVTNGVDYEHFSQTFTRSDVPEEIEEILRKQKPIIGYFGSLASWFDYELVMVLAEKRPEYEILLIGYSYDESIKRYPLNQYKNISVMGPVEYRVLPRYAYWFDVATIPFRINSITESASPIKLFEYMALGRPIVTTDMAECRKYKSVLIAKDHEAFIRKVDEALTLKNDKPYAELLRSEAIENTWGSKVQLITKLLEV